MVWVCVYVGVCRCHFCLCHFSVYAPECLRVSCCWTICDSSITSSNHCCCSAVTGKAFEIPALPCASLRSLNLADCVSLSNDGVSDFCSAMPGIVDLCLFGCLQLNDTALLGIGRAECRLERLNLAGVYKVCGGLCACAGTGRGLGSSS